MKLIKSRKAYTCDNCGDTIAKGDRYAKKTKRIGSSKPDTIEARTMDNGDRYPVIVSHGFSYAVQICEGCATPTAHTVMDYAPDFKEAIRRIDAGEPVNTTAAELGLTPKELLNVIGEALK